MTNCGAGALARQRGPDSLCRRNHGASRRTLSCRRQVGPAACLPLQRGI
jgi:hypothetical protein